MEQPIDWPQHGRHRTQALVVHLAENQVEELPERGILGHAFVTVDEVVATAEGDLEHFAVGDANVGIGDNILGANHSSAIGQSPIGLHLISKRFCSFSTKRNSKPLVHVVPTAGKLPVLRWIAVHAADRRISTVSLCGFGPFTIRKVEMWLADLLLRDGYKLRHPPTAIFYAQGVHANVLFFDRCLTDEKTLAKRLATIAVICAHHARKSGGPPTAHSSMRLARQRAERCTKGKRMVTTGWIAGQRIP
jgi:hypothetical protein